MCISKFLIGHLIKRILQLYSYCILQSYSLWCWSSDDKRRVTAGGMICLSLIQNTNLWMLNNTGYKLEGYVMSIAKYRQIMSVRASWKVLLSIVMFLLTTTKNCRLVTPSVTTMYGSFCFICMTFNSMSSEICKNNNSDYFVQVTMK